MLRLVALVLVLANAGYYAWSQRLLAAYGYAPATQSEPQRMAQQIKPEAMLVLSPSPQDTLPSQNPALSAPNAAAGECLQVGLFNDEQALVLRERLVSALPPGSWAMNGALLPARWLVYMGKYNSAESVDKKKAELRGLGVSFEVLSSPALQPGLALGNYKTQAEAEAALALITKKGVKTARVLQERAEQTGQRLTLPTVDSALRGQLDAITPLLAGKPLQSCA